MQLHKAILDTLQMHSLGLKASTGCCAPPGHMLFMRSWLRTGQPQQVPQLGSLLVRVCHP